MREELSQTDFYTPRFGMLLQACFCCVCVPEMHSNHWTAWLVSSNIVLYHSGTVIPIKRYCNFNCWNRNTTMMQCLWMYCWLHKSFIALSLGFLFLKPPLSTIWSDSLTWLETHPDSHFSKKGMDTSIHRLAKAFKSHAGRVWPVWLSWVLQEAGLAKVNVFQVIIDRKMHAQPSYQTVENEYN